MTEDRQATTVVPLATTRSNGAAVREEPLPYPELWTALVPITLGRLAKLALEQLRDHPVTPHPRSLDNGMMAQLVRDGLAFAGQVGDGIAVREPTGRTLGGRLEWTYHITPAGRAWLENCRDVPDPR